MYVELHCHSAYSFLDGASQPEELAARAAELGYEALALTDHARGSGSLPRAARGMVFKPPGAAVRERALALDGAELFDPSGNGQPFKEWVVVPAAHAGEWERLAEHALKPTA